MPGFFLLLIVYCRVVFFKPMHVREYSSTDITDCLDGKCPAVSVQITGGDSTDSDCVSRAYPKYQQESSDASIVWIFQHDKILRIRRFNSFNIGHSCK